MRRTDESLTPKALANADVDKVRTTGKIPDSFGNFDFSTSTVTGDALPSICPGDSAWPTKDKQTIPEKFSNQSKKRQHETKEDNLTLTHTYSDKDGSFERFQALFNLDAAMALQGNFYPRRRVFLSNWSLDQC